MVEKRSVPRVQASIAAAFRTGRKFQLGAILNISQNGFFIKTENLLPMDTELLLHIRLPNAPESIAIEGRVVWAKQLSSVSPPGMGIEFIRADAETRKKIELFLESEKRKLQPTEEPTRAFL